MTLNGPFILESPNVAQLNKSVKNSGPKFFNSDVKDLWPVITNASLLFLVPRVAQPVIMFRGDLLFHTGPDRFHSFYPLINDIIIYKQQFVFTLVMCLILKFYLFIWLSLHGIYYTVETFLAERFRTCWAIRMFTLKCSCLINNHSHSFVVCYCMHWWFGAVVAPTQWAWNILCLCVYAVLFSLCLWDLIQYKNRSRQSQWSSWGPIPAPNEANGNLGSWSGSLLHKGFFFKLSFK